VDLGGRKERIAVHEGAEVAKIAAAFVAAHGLPTAATARLEAILAAAIKAHTSAPAAAAAAPRAPTPAADA
jgi:hypothetical protein